MEQPNETNAEELQMTIFSMQKQLSEYIGKVTNYDVQNIKLQQENAELKKQLEEYRGKEIEEMDSAE
ncbi:hypothetical protein [Virgibacillus sp. CBA3643]|uniref:hypothetical protein n=1 Tax=Virgibacillus sp. CBA3643 TaxID=2942278 RepID=UPI0035A365A4